MRKKTGWQRGYCLGCFSVSTCSTDLTLFDDNGWIPFKNGKTALNLTYPFCNSLTSFPSMLCRILDLFKNEIKNHEHERFYYMKKHMK